MEFDVCKEKLAVTEEEAAEEVVVVLNIGQTQGELEERA